MIYDWWLVKIVRAICRFSAMACFGPLVPCWLCVAPSAAQQKEIRVAAAADLQFAMPELAREFEKLTDFSVSASYGSSGNFFSQIQNGAPFDAFFSADLEYPRKLVAAGFCEPGTMFTYGIGRIVIWAPATSPVNVQKLGWKALLDPLVQRIAIANPVHAPYGRAAVAALESAGIYEQVKQKLVYGENISQTAQFVESGNAQASIIALSLTYSPELKNGQQWSFPQEFYPPLKQGAVVLKSAKEKEGARAFLKFVNSAAGRAILEKYGFRAPPRN